MKKYSELEVYDLLARVEFVKTELSGRSGPVFDGYRGQFFWCISGESCTDWVASYTFEHGELHPGANSRCKIVLGQNIKELAKGEFREGAQFAIREGTRIVAIGSLLEVIGSTRKVR